MYTVMVKLKDKRRDIRLSINYNDKHFHKCGTDLGRSVGETSTVQLAW